MGYGILKDCKLGDIPYQHGFVMYRHTLSGGNIYAVALVASEMYGKFKPPRSFTPVESLEAGFELIVDFYNSNVHPDRKDFWCTPSFKECNPNLSTIFRARITKCIDDAYSSFSEARY